MTRVRLRKFVFLNVLWQLGRDEVGDFTDSVVKLPTLVTLKLA